MTLEGLDISQNVFSKGCFAKWSTGDCVGLFCLTSLNLSYSANLDSNDILMLLNGLRSKSMGENGGEWLEPQMRELNLKDTNISDEAGKMLCLMMTSNSTLEKVNLEENTLS